MRNCNDYQKLIPLYISHDLTTTDQQAVAAHLKECAQCRKYAQAMTKITDMIAAQTPQPEYGYGSELLINIRQRLDQYQRKNRTLRWLIPTLASAAAMLLIIFLTLFNTPTPQMAEDLDKEAVESYYEFGYAGYFGESDAIDLQNISEDEFSQTEQEINRNFAYYLLESDRQISAGDYAEATVHLSENSFNSLLQSLQQSTL